MKNASATIGYNFFLDTGLGIKKSNLTFQQYQEIDDVYTAQINGEIDVNEFNTRLLTLRNDIAVTNGLPPMTAPEMLSCRQVNILLTPFNRVNYN